MTSTPTAPVELLQMDFEGVEAQDYDIPSMSTLLNQLVKESGVDSGQLAKVLVSQNYVGSVLKPCLDDVDMDDDEQPEDQSVFSIASIINLSERREPVVKEIQKFIRNFVRNPEYKVEKDRSVFQKVMNEDSLTDVKLGFLIKERILNMPVDLLHPSLQSLMRDIETAIEKKMPYKFTHLVYWSKMYVDKGTAQHYDIEDSWFEENAISHFSYPLKHADTVMVDSDETAAGAQPIRRIYLFEYAKMTNFLDYLQTVL
ncbi:Protein BCCIP [Orchesella cincta]|uniref:Protein BCCIP n=1 Tax=Orchesella cincta TaxID=48709 RepID=A0A1D2N009_ORCCI|nr:Protein BCCIP [Orchesella cincta]